MTRSRVAGVIAPGHDTLQSGFAYVRARIRELRLRNRNRSDVKNVPARDASIQCSMEIGAHKILSGFSKMFLKNVSTGSETGQLAPLGSQTAAFFFFRT